MCERKPPLGLKPRNIFEEERIHEIFQAMMRYRQSHQEIPEEWIAEFNDLMRRSK